MEGVFHVFQYMTRYALRDCLVLPPLIIITGRLQLFLLAKIVAVCVIGGFFFPDVIITE
jgi:hypothetical protein